VLAGVIGATGALVVLYEVHHTKRIAQATFVRDLNTAFCSDSSVFGLWEKLLLNTAINREDRAQISSYLTFFETIHLLLTRRVIDFNLVDNLFRNRFFTAIGDPNIQTIALMSEADSFVNIHDLADQWSRFLRRQGSNQHPGYLRYLEGKLRRQGFLIERMGPESIDDILAIQSDIHETLKHDEWLRSNDRDVWHDSLKEHHTIGIRNQDSRLVAVAVLYDAGMGPESIAKYVESDSRLVENSVNLKIVLVSPDERQRGLGRAIVQLAANIAKTNGKFMIYCTIHRDNKPSKKLFESLGYQKIRNVETMYGKRDIHRLIINADNVLPTKQIC
jgi:RimJ/RimL family protein N-acetyltransferase